MTNSATAPNTEELEVGQVVLYRGSYGEHTCEVVANVDCGEQDWQLRFAPRGGSSVASIPVVDLAPTEAFRAISGRLALEARNPSGGAGMPGALSDTDREFLRNINPNLGLTKEGNQLHLEVFFEHVQAAATPRWPFHAG